MERLWEAILSPAPAPGSGDLEGSWRLRDLDVSRPAPRGPQRHGPHRPGVSGTRAGTGAARRPHPEAHYFLGGAERCLVNGAWSITQTSPTPETRQPRCRAWRCRGRRPRHADPSPVQGVLIEDFGSASQGGRAVELHAE
ncbi:MAG: hypothetical protein ACLTSG_00030 [Lachnospiraceae bacterium]